MKLKESSGLMTKFANMQRHSDSYGELRRSKQALKEKMLFYLFNTAGDCVPRKANMNLQVKVLSWQNLGAM